MSESAARVRQPIDLDEFERRLRGPAPVARSTEDPLAELARLVGSEPPFGVPRPTPAEQAAGYHMEPQAQAAEPAAPEHYAQEAASQEQSAFYDYEQPAPAQDALRPSFEEPVAQQFDPRFDAPPQSPQQARAEPQIDFSRFEAELLAMDSAPQQQQRFAAPAADLQPSRSIQMSAPRFDEGPAAPRMDDDAYAPPPVFLADEAEERRPRRKIYLMSAALAVVFGAIGIGLVMRGGGKTSGEAPTIMAAQGPVKVQPANPGGVDLPNQTSSVLDKGKVDRVSTSRVVSNQEQPVDLARAPAPARPALPAIPPSAEQGGPPAATASNGFPEPKRVKTVSVRPDGSVISGDAPAEAPRAPARPSIASLPLNPSGAAAKPAAPAPVAAKPAPTAAAPVAPAPAAPKATARVTTPKVETAALGDAPARATPKPAAAKPEAAAATGAGGTYAVQLAALPSEQEARETSSRLSKKFASELGSHRPSVVKAAVGEKSVYRVRVSGLSKDAATALCGSIQSGGGACFVAKN